MPQEKEDRVFIIIVTYNAMQWLFKCIESTRPHWLIVVDNNSTDGTLNFLKSNYPEIKVFQQNKNLGFGQANNIGISYALKQNAEYVFLLNQDAYLQTNCIEELVDVHKKNKDYGILSPIHLNGRGDKLDQKFSYYVGYASNPNFYSDYVLEKPKQEIYKMAFVNAAGWLLSRKCLEMVGGFDPIFFHYGEDENYCHRVIYHGFKIGVASGIFLAHDRENRNVPLIKNGSKKYFERLERQIKLKYSDINFKGNLNELIKKRKRTWLKASLKLNFAMARYYKNEYDLLRRIKPEIERSKASNKLSGKTYLE